MYSCFEKGLSTSASSLHVGRLLKMTVPCRYSCKSINNVCYRNQTNMRLITSKYYSTSCNLINLQCVVSVSRKKKLSCKMTDAMSKKEKLARGSAVIKVMKVIPRPGNYLKSFVDPRKLPRAIPAGGAPRGILAEMPWLDVKNAIFNLSPDSAKVKGNQVPLGTEGKEDICNPGADEDDRDPSSFGLPDGDPMIQWYQYRTWLSGMNPLSDGNIAEHFNIMLGLLISMTKDPENENFADVEAYPCVQFLRSIKTENGEVPYNVASFIEYIEFVCQKQIDEG